MRIEQFLLDNYNVFSKFDFQIREYEYLQPKYRLKFVVQCDEKRKIFYWNCIVLPYSDDFFVNFSSESFHKLCNEYGIMVDSPEYSGDWRIERFESKELVNVLEKFRIKNFEKILEDFLQMVLIETV